MTSRSKPASRPPGGPRRAAATERASHPYRASLADLAYERLEEMIVTCALAPGAYLSIQELQERTQLGRTPIHQSVNRLASDTLMLVRPRHGLQIAPIDLERERTLLQLRREMERFVVRLAAERSGASHRNQFLHIAGLLRDGGAGMTIVEFNQLDRRIDHLLIAAAGESFLEHTLRPLHTIFRRIGWIYHSRVRPDEGMGRTIDCHLSILDAVAANQAGAAVAASDQLVEFSGSMFEVLGAGVDPALFDCNLARLAAR